MSNLLKSFKIADLAYYVKLYQAHRIAQRFRAEYEHLARDVPFHPEMGVRLDVYSPATGSGHPILIFVHGGAWSEYSKELFAPVAMKLLPEKMVVVVPDHTLYPDAGYEQMAGEVAAALSWTLENIERYGGDARRVVIAGHSSGGHLVGLAVMDPRFLRVHGHTEAEVCGMALLSGSYDIQAQYGFERAKDGSSLAETILGVMGGEGRFSAASPVSYARPDLPPTLILHGGEDQTIPVSIASDFHAALQEAGGRSELKVYPGRGHSEMLFAALVEERAQIVADISDFVHGLSPVSL